MSVDITTKGDLSFKIIQALSKSSVELISTSKLFSRKFPIYFSISGFSGPISNNCFLFIDISPSN